MFSNKAQDDAAVESLRTQLENTQPQLRNAQQGPIQPCRDQTRRTLRVPLSTAKMHSKKRTTIESYLLKSREVFAMLKFQKPNQLPVGGFRIFTQQQKVIDRNLKQFIAKNPELEVVEVEKLRFDPSPRGKTSFSI
ncbi:hypothetical protein BGZ76_005578 [Entomortierella beljakovae]|nr:hypothetical protein BGZ76_005578 [Entomortierella beljakovae]